MNFRYPGMRAPPKMTRISCITGQVNSHSTGRDKSSVKFVLLGRSKLSMPVIWRMLKKPENRHTAIEMVMAVAYRTSSGALEPAPIFALFMKINMIAKAMNATPWKICATVVAPSNWNSSSHTV